MTRASTDPPSDAPNDPSRRVAERPADRVRNRLLAVAAAALVLFTLRASRAVTLPLALGLTFAVLAWPIQRAVARRAPRWLGVLAAVLSILVVIGGLVAALWWSADLLADRGRQHRERIEQLRDRAAAVGARFGVQIPGAGGSSGGSSGAPSGGASSGGAGGTGVDTGQSEGGGGGGSSGVAQRAATGLYENLTSIALAIGFAALALAEIDALVRRVRSRFDGETARRGLAIGAEVAESVRRYFAVKSLTSLITGVSTGLYTLAVGLDLAPIWGLLAFLLEYVPSIGSLIAVIPPTVFAFVEFGGLTRPLAIGAGLAALQLILGNFVDPKIEGRFMSVSPLVVLLSIVFWAWVWGPFGALLGVPVTVALTIVARHFPGSWWAWALLTEEEKEEKGEQGRGRRS